MSSRWPLSPSSSELIAQIVSDADDGFVVWISLFSLYVSDFHTTFRKAKVFSDSLIIYMLWLFSAETYEGDQKVRWLFSACEYI
jgi:hypothetical protein